ncbi:MAG: hypothetical protein ACLRM8_01545 [Alistipes sp.]
MGSDRELAHVHGLMSQLRKPWFTVPGNHETTWSESGCTTFRRLFDMRDASPPAPRVISFWAMPAGLI